MHIICIHYLSCKSPNQKDSFYLCALVVTDLVISSQFETCSLETFEAWSPNTSLRGRAWYFVCRNEKNMIDFWSGKWTVSIILFHVDNICRINFFLVCSLVGLFVLVPLNYIAGDGEQPGHSHSMDEFTITNISKGSDWWAFKELELYSSKVLKNGPSPFALIWMHLACTYFY